MPGSKKIRTRVNEWLLMQEYLVVVIQASCSNCSSNLSPDKMEPIDALRIREFFLIKQWIAKQ